MSGMRCRLKCEEPNKIDFTLTITMSAENWEKLRDQMKDSQYSWPMSDLSRQINELLGQARKIYWPKTPEDDA